MSIEPPLLSSSRDARIYDVASSASPARGNSTTRSASLSNVAARSAHSHSTTQPKQQQQYCVRKTNNPHMTADVRERSRCHSRHTPSHDDNCALPQQQQKQHHARSFSARHRLTRSVLADRKHYDLHYSVHPLCHYQSSPPAVGRSSSHRAFSSPQTRRSRSRSSRLGSAQSVAVNFAHGAAAAAAAARASSHTSAMDFASGEGSRVGHLRQRVHGPPNRQTSNGLPVDAALTELPLSAMMHNLTDGVTAFTESLNTAGVIPWSGGNNNNNSKMHHTASTQAATASSPGQHTAMTQECGRGGVVLPHCTQPTPSPRRAAGRDARTAASSAPCWTMPSPNHDSRCGNNHDNTLPAHTCVTSSALRYGDAAAGMRPVSSLPCDDNYGSSPYGEDAIGALDYHDCFGGTGPTRTATEVVMGQAPMPSSHRPWSGTYDAIGQPTPDQAYHSSNNYDEDAMNYPTRVSHAVLLRGAKNLLQCAQMTAQPRPHSSPEATGARRTTRNDTFRSAVNAEAPLFTDGMRSHDLQRNAQHVPVSSFLPADNPRATLSYPARLLLSVVLYIRAMGGFPTMLRVGPVPLSCRLTHPENCLELVFLLPPGDAAGAEDALSTRHRRVATDKAGTGTYSAMLDPMHMSVHDGAAGVRSPGMSEAERALHWATEQRRRQQRQLGDWALPTQTTSSLHPVLPSPAHDGNDSVHGAVQYRKNKDSRNGQDDCAVANRDHDGVKDEHSRDDAPNSTMPRHGSAGVPPLTHVVPSERAARPGLTIWEMQSLFSADMPLPPCTTRHAHSTSSHSPLSPHSTWYDAAMRAHDTPLRNNDMRATGSIHNCHSHIDVHGGSDMNRELRVVIRAVMARKTTVTRFGRTEVVHVLPPLISPSPPTRAMLSTALSHAPSNEPPSPRRTSGMPATRHPLAVPAVAPPDNTSSAESWGDWAVAFILSGSASQLTGTLPEAMELTDLRYRVFRLHDYCESDPHGMYTDEANTPFLANPFALFSQTAGTSRSSTIHLETTDDMHAPSSAAVAALCASRFPLYRASSVAERTLRQVAQQCRGGGDETARERQLRQQTGRTHTRARGRFCGGGAAAPEPAPRTLSSARSVGSSAAALPASEFLITVKNRNMMELERELLRFRPLDFDRFYHELLEAVQYTLEGQRMRGQRSRA